MNNLQKLLKILSKKQKLNIIILSFFLLVMSIMEIFFLQSILILVNSISGSKDPYFFDLLHTMGILNYFNNPLNLILILFFLFFLVKSLFNIFIIKYEAKFIYRTREVLTNNFFNKYVGLPKLFHVKLSLANLTKKIILQVDDLTVAIRSLSILFLEILILILITIYLLTINFYLTIYIFAIFSICSVLILIFNKKKITEIGIDQLKHNEGKIKIVNEILSSLKFFKNKKFNESISKKFFFHNKKTNDISIIIAFKNGFIRPIFEIVILLVIVTTLLYIYLNNLVLNDFLSQFAVFLAASYRLMPSYARIISSYQTYKYHIQPVKEYYEDSINLFDNKNYFSSNKKVNFERSLELKKISFHHNLDNKKNKKTILKDINIVLKKNSKICIVGESGSGKSTLLDLIMGLIQPYEGKTFIDGKEISLTNNNWQSKISFVPQNVFITSDSLKKNIAFGLEDNEIDNSKVNFYLDFCNLRNFTESLDKGIETKLSDSGTNISGGQKQRVGIARALYSQPDLLILDEPTNNLDEINEKDITEKLLTLQNVTLLLTTHKQEIISKFNKVYEIKNQLVKERI